MGKTIIRILTLVIPAAVCAGLVFYAGRVVHVPLALGVAIAGLLLFAYAALVAHVVREWAE
jgi:hypothetical protein